MTEPASDTMERAPRRKRRGGLYLTDTELIEELGLPQKAARDAFLALDRNPKSGFPARQKLWGDRRYLPAVLAYFDKINGLTVGTSANQRGAND
jgi:hypothetical protein